MLKVDTSAIDAMGGIDPITKKQLKNQAIAQATAEHQSFIKEYNRYKQDCRKRALEMSHMESARKTEIVIPPSTTLENADKYYNWLISIPEK